MAHPLTIQISDAAFHSLQLRAKLLGKTPESVAAECIAQSLGDAPNDPLLRWAGALDSPVNDVAQRHDQYLGDSIAAERTGGVDG